MVLADTQVAQDVHFPHLQGKDLQLAVARNGECIHPVYGCQRAQQHGSSHLYTSQEPPAGATSPDRSILYFVLQLHDPLDINQLHLLPCASQSITMYEWHSYVMASGLRSDGMSQHRHH